MEKISLYKLLGLVKDKKAPAKVFIRDKVYYLLEDDEHYVYSLNDHDIKAWDNFIDYRVAISQNLDEEVLILENSDNEIITEDISDYLTTMIDCLSKTISILKESTNEQIKILRESTNEQINIIIDRIVEELNKE